MAITKYDPLCMSSYDANQVEDYAQMWETANAAGDAHGVAAAHAGAERIRMKYRYSGGDDGSEYLPLEPARSLHGGITQSSSRHWEGNSMDGMGGLSSGPQYIVRDPFSYNAKKDPLYKYYRTQYTREGKRAMEDTLGIISAKTDGMASSYATTASQQTYDNYMQELTDKIPELQQLAYSMYVTEGEALQRASPNSIVVDRNTYKRYLK